MILTDLQVSVDRDALDWITLGISSVLAILALAGFWSSNKRYKTERSDRLAERQDRLDERADRQKADTRAERAEARAQRAEKVALEESRSVRLEATRAQARLITAWAMGQDGSGNLTRYVRNGSDQAAYNVRLLNPRDSGREQSIGVLPPGEVYADATGLFDGVALPGNTVAVAIRFADADNREWFRDWFGELHGPVGEAPDFDEKLSARALPNWTPRT